MIINRINGFKDFLAEIDKIGFCMSGTNGEDIFNINAYYAEDIEYHTGDNELDPWRWRIRGITESEDLFYGKVFFKKAGWVTKAWLSDFIAVRRKGLSFEELYEDGLMTQMEKQVYELIQNRVNVSLNEINLEIGKTHKKDIAKAIVSLQMKFLTAISGETYKVSSKGEPYGWPVTVFSTLEEKFGQKVTEEAKLIDPSLAFGRIQEQIMKLNPDANDKKIKAFIKMM